MVSEEPYTNDCMQNRNIWMIDQLTSKDDLLITVWDGTSGGTCNCIKYAGTKEPRIQMERIDPRTLL